MRATYYNDYNYMERVQMQRMQRIARTKQVRRQKLIILGIFLTILIYIIFSLKAFVYANDTNNVDYGTKQYRSVVIYCHDTVESIAEDNICEAYDSIDDYVKEIRSINKLSTYEKLIPGNYLIVPYYS